jgi:hypothetical protein
VSDGIRAVLILSDSTGHIGFYPRRDLGGEKLAFLQEHALALGDLVAGVAQFTRELLRKLNVSFAR